MLMLMLQTFLLLLGAFLLGAMLACLTKRTFAGAEPTLDEPVMPQEAVYTSAPPVSVVPPSEGTDRFGRALAGGVPVVEVQPAPEPLPVAPPPPRPAQRVVAEPAVVAPRPPVVDNRTYCEIAVASHDGSTLPADTLRSVTLPAPRMPQPSPEPLPVPRVDVPRFPRPADAPDGPAVSYATSALAESGGYRGAASEPPAVDIALSAYDDALPFDELGEGESYTLIAAGGRRAPAAAAGGGLGSYIEAALDQSGGYVEPAAPPAGPDITLTPYDPSAPAATPPDGRSYVSVAVDGAVGEVSSPADFDAPLVTSAVAAAAGIAAQRAAEQRVDDLTRIVGIDEVLASRLNYAGVTRFAQVAAWSADDVYRMSQTLGYFDESLYAYWIQQARLLSGAAAPVAVTARADRAERLELRSGNAAESATAAAAAAAAAMAAAATARTRSDPPVSQDAGTGGAASRTDLAGLRSVRSEALRGDGGVDLVRGDIDDLKRIRGIGVLIEKKLNSLGVTSYEQVANWAGPDIDRISEILDFKGRIERENWIEQARILASGGQTEFSRRVDKGEA